MLVWFSFIFFVILIPVLAFKLAIFTADNIMGVITVWLSH